ncbi:MAG: hypothetical protein ACI4VP_01055 [Clostridia bacterium]
MKISVIKNIGIEIDDEYKWKDTLFLDEYVSSDDENVYKECKQFIKLKYTKKLDFSEARMIEKNLFVCNKYIYDKEKKAKIYFENDNTCVIESNQESNEWLIIMLQIMLLKEGYSFIHAAAVSKNGVSLLMPSWGGVGKTASVAKLIKNDYKLLGDDLNIINKQGKIYAFPKKFVLYFYHKELFPEVFKEKKVWCNSQLNSLYTNIIPTVKKILRYIPGFLSFARRHNPQSIKVSPVEIFKKEKIDRESNIEQIMWIERNIGKKNFEIVDSNKLISKAISVTMNELFTDNITAILIMCGIGMISYNDVFNNMNEIFHGAFTDKECSILNVSKTEDVSVVANEVLKHIKI